MDEPANPLTVPAPLPTAAPPRAWANPVLCHLKMWFWPDGRIDRRSFWLHGLLPLLIASVLVGFTCGLFSERGFVRSWNLFVAWPLFAVLRAALRFRAGQDTQALEDVSGALRFAETVANSGGALIHVIVGYSVRAVALDQLAEFAAAPRLTAAQLRGYLTVLDAYAKDPKSVLGFSVVLPVAFGKPPASAEPQPAGPRRQVRRPRRWPPAVTVTLEPPANSAAGPLATTDSWPGDPVPLWSGPRHPCLGAFAPSPLPFTPRIAWCRAAA